MNVKIKKIFTGFLLAIFLFSNIGVTDITLAKSNKSDSKKEFDLKTKFSGEKLKKVKNSLSKKDNYKLVIKSPKTLEELKDSYKLLDPNIKIKDIGEGVYSLKISKNSLLANDLTGIDNGVLPEKLGDETVLEPEIFEKDDYLTGEQTGSLWYLDKIGAPSFQEELSTKDKIKVGILDTGIDSNQDDLKDNYDNSLSYDFVNNNSGSLDDNGHGTQVVGVLGAEVNGKGIYGVNSNSDLVSLKVLDKDGLGTSYDTLEAIDYAVKNNIKVLNLSFGGNRDPSISEVCRAITQAKKAGTFVIVSAGNTSTDVSNIVPAGCSDAIVIGSTDINGNKSSFSNYGTGVDIYTPGENIYTTDLNNNYTTKNGTSFSSPIVAGLISKELAYNSSLTYDEILNNVKNNYNLKTDFISLPESPSPLAPLPVGEGNSGSLSDTGSLDNTLSGITLSGTIDTQIDFSKTKYYSGYFIHEGKTYGNSLYDDSFSFTSEDLKGVQVYTYDEYQNIIENSKKEFSTMSIPTNGLIGKWDLNGNALDSSGNGNNGTPYNVTWVDSGRGDGTLVASFNGSSSYISVGNLGINGGPITASVWYKPEINTTQGVQGLFSQRNSNTITGYNIFYDLNGKRIIFLRNRPNVVTNAVSYNTTLNNSYYNLILKYDGYNVTGYINGIWIGVNVVSTGNGRYSLANGIEIGRDIEGVNAYVKGSISNVRIYNLALSDTEIEQLYQDGLTSVNKPTLPTQEIQSPGLDKQEVKLGEKIGKFQSGDGIILSASLNNTSGNKQKLDFEVYKLGGTIPVYTKSTDYFTSGTGTITVPFLGAGDYFWKVRATDENGNSSEWVEFGNNNSNETDFSWYEGFEPYPYGYKFYNRKVADGVLTGSGYFNWKWYFDFSYSGTEKPYVIVDGNKWDIFKKTFDLSNIENSDKKMIDAFESVGLNQKNAFQYGNCYGMAVSAAMQYGQTGALFFKNNYPNFSSQIGSGYIWDKISSPNTSTNIHTWDIYNDTLEAILSFQLSQYSNHVIEAKNNAIINPLEIVKELENHPNNVYVLSFYGIKEVKEYQSDGTYILKKEDSGHSVIPYKIEKTGDITKIYVWDNNYPFPYSSYDTTKKGYNQYITVDSNGKWEANTYKYDEIKKGRISFDKISLVNISTLVKKSAPNGFSNTDISYSLSGESDLYLVDNLGNISGFKDGKILEQIPGVQPIVPLNDTLDGESVENTFKQIYIPQKIDGLTIRVSGKTDENYDLMIAGGDYYTKVSGVNTSSGQTDIYNSTGTGLSVDFDDTKTGTGKYDIMLDNFQNNGTGTVYIPQIENQTGLQTLDINWNNVVNNTNNAVVYQADTNNDGIIDISKTSQAIENPVNTTKEKSSISGKINILEDQKIKKDEKEKYNDIILMLERKDEDKNEKEKKKDKDDKHKEKYIKRQLIKIAKDGTFKLENIKPGSYRLEIVNDEKKNKVIKPESGYYELEIKNGFDYINKDFDIVKNYKEEDNHKNKK